MNAPAEPPSFTRARFRTKVLVAMMLVVSLITAAALFFAQRGAAATVERDLRRQFQGELAALHTVQEIRHAALVERCRALVRKPRIHAALEDGALDLLYLSARDELRDVMEPAGEQAGTPALHAKFYRFLDRAGRVIAPPRADDVGRLEPDEERRLALPAAPDRKQLGYLALGGAAAGGELAELIAMPIASTENGETIAALVLGFEPADLGASRARPEIRRGLWLDGRLHLPALDDATRASLEAEVSRAIAASPQGESRLGVTLGGTPHLLFSKRLNPDSWFPPAYEVCVYSLAELVARQRSLRWEIMGAGVLLFLGGLGASHVLSGRLARPVEKLAVDSEENRAQRRRAETALGLTHEELQRAARFSADASHQLKTPVAVMRAGLEELLAREHLTPEEREEVSALVHQTYRLTNVIEDLLLLSRMDAGRLKLELVPVDLSSLIEASFDDLGAIPDALDLEIETKFPRDILIAGEKRYTALILQNLLENARKYNRPGGWIHLAGRVEGDDVFVTIGNTGKPITPAAQARIFERFHRGAVGENVPGHGLGLNLARELARLHGGELRLVRSDEAWTEFELRLRLAPAPADDPREAS